MNTDGHGHSPEPKAAQQRTHSMTLRALERPGEVRQVLECVRCCAALARSKLKPFSMPFRRDGAGSTIRRSTLDLGSRISDFQGTATNATRQPLLLDIRGLVKRFGSVSALAGVDLPVARGSVLALLGPNGAGKSTLFGCLLGLVRPTAGQITFEGGELRDEDRLRFGYVAERIALYPHRSVSENGLFFTRLRGHSADDFAAQLRRVGLASVQDRPVCQLSKGMLQRLGLAIALCGRPELLVLDEPFNGLDPALLDELQEILRAESQRGATLLVATHTISAIEPLATEVAILLDGQFALNRTVEQLRGEFPGQSLEAVYHQVARRHRATLACEVKP